MRGRRRVMYTGGDPNVKCNKSLNEATVLCIFMPRCGKRLTDTPRVSGGATSSLSVCVCVLGVYIILPDATVGDTVKF